MPVSVIVRLVLTAALALASLVVLELSVVAVAVTIVVVLTLPTLPPRPRALAYATVSAAALASLVGLTRFVLEKAMAGIAEAGQRAVTKSAIWRMREIVIAEDGARKRAVVDPDHDGVGSALFVAELAGLAGVRGGPPLERPLLNYRFRESVETAIGPAVRVGSHLIVVCLPERGGGFTARPDRPIDEERAERRFVAYAWPAERSVDIAGAIFVDEHERILLSSAATFRGPAHPPSCTSALGGNSEQWQPWHDKAPRKTLPGERSERK